MFREFCYGLFFYLCAMLGMVLGVVLLVPSVRAGSIETEIKQQLVASMIGAVCGSAAWLLFKRICLSPTDQAMSARGKAPNHHELR